MADVLNRNRFWDKTNPKTPETKRKGKEMSSRVLITIVVFVTIALEVGAITWTSCPFPDPAGTSGLRFDCTTVVVPLSYEEPARWEPLSLWVTRLSRRGATARRQLWMMNGGPGMAEEPMAIQIGSLGDFVKDLRDDIEVFFPSHRSTGLSRPWLNCTNADFPHAAQCAKEIVARWGTDGVHQFSTTNAARDLDRLLNEFRGAATEQHLYCFSYGTFLCQRLLLNHTAQVRTVALDGVVEMDQGLFSHFDVNMHIVGRDLMSACGADAFCAGAFGGEDPYSRLSDLFTAIRADPASTCFSKLADPWRKQSELLPLIFGQFVQVSLLRQFIPAIVHRLLRSGRRESNQQPFLVQQPESVGSSHAP